MRVRICLITGLRAAGNCSKRVQTRYSCIHLLSNRFVLVQVVVQVSWAQGRNTIKSKGISKKCFVLNGPYLSNRIRRNSLVNCLQEHLQRKCGIPLFQLKLCEIELFPINDLKESIPNQIQKLRHGGGRGAAGRLPDSGHHQIDSE